MKKHLLFFLLSFANSFFAVAQRTIHINHADYMEGGDYIEKGVKRLLGNVDVNEGDTYMYCDSAYIYQDNTIKAFNNLHIVKGDSVNIYGTFLNYSGKTKIAEITKNVRLIEKGSTLQTELLYYDMHTSMANYPNGGTIINKNNTLTSQYGYYNPKKKMFSFKKNVILTSPEYIMNCDTLNYSAEINTVFFNGPTNITSKGDHIYCEAGWYNTTNNNALFSKNAFVDTRDQKMKGDTILYDKVNNIGKAFGHVSIIDSTQSIIVNGDKAIRIGELETATVIGHALLKQFYRSDTLFLHADTLRAVDEHPINKKNVKDTSITWRVFYAYRKVKFFRTDIQGKCDSLIYSSKDSLMRLFKDPVLWQEKNQLTAEKIEIKTSNGAIKNLFLKNNAFIISEEDSLMYSQIKGKQMTGYFKENKLSKIFVEGNGQTIYFVKEKRKKKEILIGVNRATCSNLMIYIKGNGVEKITFLKKPEATLFPMSDFTPKEFLLKDFIWRGRERPDSVLDLF
jgi:lipopolysaccharide export system protein LptA